MLGAADKDIKTIITVLYVFNTVNGDRRSRGECEGWIRQCHGESLNGDGCVHYFECGVDFTDVYVVKTLNFILYICAVY